MSNLNDDQDSSILDGGEDRHLLVHDDPSVTHEDMSPLIASAPKKKATGKVIILLILVGINLLNYLDRYTISGILPDLKDVSTSGLDHDLSDSEGGLLMTVFVVSYMLFSPIFGYYGDRVNRKVLITIGIIFWSIFTLMGSFTKTYLQLMVARGFVGIGEASYATIAPTIIADLYPPEIRTMMLSVFYFAIPVGAALGFIVGGQVAAALGSWRWALRVSPPLGVALALCLFFFTKDPPRGASDGHVNAGAANENTGILAMVKDVKQILKVRSFIWSTLGFTAVTFTSGAMAQWAPTYVYRMGDQEGHSISSATASLAFGAVTVVTGVIGTFYGSWLSKKYTAMTLKADSYICGLGLLASVAFMGVAIPSLPYSQVAFWILVFFGELTLCLNWAPSAAITLYVHAPHMRASANAVNILITHLFGDAMSPFLVGLMSDTIHTKYDITSADSLMLAQLLTVVVALIGGVCYLRSATYLPDDRAKAGVVQPLTDYQVVNDDDGKPYVS
eukprot:m.46073 g.46073  ORF g.46073 m.46073 type:complete len:504 (+) comp7249_c0_seq1:90-1601(+)